MNGKEQKEEKWKTNGDRCDVLPLLLAKQAWTGPALKKGNLSLNLE